MDEVTHVEVLGRHGEVVARHAVRRLPARIGRAYDNDVILDDPYVALHHAVLERAPTGGLEIVDAGSRNGLHRAGARARLDRAPVDPDARYIAGRTALRIRESSHVLPPELVDLREGWWQQAALAVAAIVASAGMVLLYGWSTTYEQPDLAKLVLPIVTVLLALLLWSGAWTLVGRLLIGEWRLAAHITGGALIVVGYFVAANWDYVAFALSAPWLRYVESGVLGAFVAWSFLRHFTLVTRDPGRGVAVAAVVMAMVSIGSLELYAQVEGADDPARMTYLRAIKPPAVRLAQGREPEAFFKAAEQLRVEVEPLRTK